MEKVDVEDVEEVEEDVVDSSEQKDKRGNGGEGSSSRPACQKQEKLVSEMFVWSDYDFIKYLPGYDTHSVLKSMHIAAI